MRRLKLSGKSTEIYEALPKEWAATILNSIIVKSLNYRNCFFREASVFLTEQELEEVKEKIQYLLEESQSRPTDTAQSVIKKKIKKGEYQPKVEVEDKNSLTSKERKAVDAFVF